MDPVVLVTNISTPEALIIGILLGWAYASWHHKRSRRTFVQILHPNCIHCSGEMSCARCSNIELNGRDVDG